MERTDRPTPQPTPAPAKPNPAAAAAYTQAATHYETAARDALRRGAPTRAADHLRRAEESRALAAAYTAGTGTPNPDELLRRARALAVTA